MAHEKPQDQELRSALNEGMGLIAILADNREKNTGISMGFVSGPRLDAHRILQATILKMLRDQSRLETNDMSENTQYQMSLLANLAGLIDLTYETLLGGMYVGACALIRQSYEMNARLAELQGGHQWVTTKAPNVGRLPSDTRRFYGEMSKVAHFSDPVVGRLTEIEIDATTTGHSINPVVKEHPLLRLFDLHLMTISLTLYHQLEFFETVYKNDVGKYELLASAAIEPLKEAGVWGRGDDSNAC